MFWSLLVLLGTPALAQDSEEGPSEPEAAEPEAAEPEAAESEPELSEPSGAQGLEAQSSKEEGGVPWSKILRPRAELRGELLGTGLQGLSSGGAGLGFGISRGRVGVDLRPSPGVRSVVIVDVRQNGAVQTVPVGDSGGSVRVDSYPGDWEAHLPFAYVQLTGETGPLAHQLVAGVQRPTFGVRDAYDLEEAFYVPHPGAFQDMGRRSGVVPSFDLGVRYSAEFKELVALDLMASNGTGWRRVEDNFGKHLTARLRLTPIEQVEVRATGVAGWEGTDNDTVFLAWQASAQASVGPVRLLVEALGGKTYAPAERVGFLGGAAALALELALPLESVDRVVPVVSFQRYDPTTGVAAGDAWTLIAVGAPLYWRTWNDLPFWTGLSWEMAVTEDPSRPVNHSAALQVGWRI